MVKNKNYKNNKETTKIKQTNKNCKNNKETTKSNKLVKTNTNRNKQNYKKYK